MPYATIPAGSYDADSPITDEFLDSVVGNEDWLKALLESHVHSGADGTAAIEIGPNWCRNGNFERGLINWTATTYTGGTIATTTSAETEGATGVSITSTVNSNGGGNLLADEFIPVIGGQTRQFMLTTKASGSTVPIKAQAVWYDDAQAQISTTDIISVTTSPTTDRLVIRRLAAPASARYVRVKLELPTGAGGTGTIYFDTVIVGLPHRLGGEQVFTANGTFSAIWGDLFVEVQGGGAGCSSTVKGGAGGYACGPVTTSADITVTVGAATASGANNGNSSSFGSLMSATGGTASATPIGGGGSGGSINITGSAGSAHTNGGAPSFYGGSPRPGAPGSDGGYGASGGFDGVSSNTGGPGIVIVRW